MNKKKILGIVGIVVIAVVALIIISSALNAPEGTKFDGTTYYEGDKIYTKNQTEGSQGMRITQINKEDNSFISESPDGKYKMKWDTTTGLGKWLVKNGTINPYA
ncbi:MAG: hypothetical protein ACRC1M_00975 [Methanobacteriaceae archaeon]